MNRTLARRIAPAAALAALLLTAAQPAIADHVDPDYPVYEGCPNFNITLGATGGNQDIRVTRIRDGLVYTIIGGHGTLLTVTRLDAENHLTDKSVTFTTNGSVTKLTSNEKTTLVELSGFNLFVLFPEDPGGPSTILYTGRVVGTVDTTTFAGLGPLATTGRQRDICAELAG